MINKLKKISIILSIIIVSIVMLFIFINNKNIKIAKIFNKKILADATTNINDNNVIDNQTNEKFILKGKYDENKKQILLNWDLDNSENYIYKCFQKKETSNEFQTVSSTTFKDEEYIKVLNVYPNVGNNLAGWMNSYGMGIINVDEVPITTFNSSPNDYLKDGDGNWKYNVLVFGFWDSNNGYDLNATSEEAVKQFIEDGNGCIFGHDTIRSGFPYFLALAPYVNIQTTGYWANNSTTDIYLYKQGVFTSYPWYIGEVGTHLTIPTAHTLDQIANGDIWIKFNNNANGAGNTNFYLTTWNNCAMIQTGHSSGAATVDEQKILANLIFYTNQLISVTQVYDYSGTDMNAPKSVNNISQKIIDSDTLEIKYSEPEDVGTKYNYYIQGIPKLNNLSNIQSNEIVVEAKSGIAGYSYKVDNSEACTDLDKTIDTTDTKIRINKTTLNQLQTTYLHIAAIDEMGNMSEVKTVELIKGDPEIFFYEIDENNAILGATTSKKIDYLKYSDDKTGQIIKLTCNGKQYVTIDYNIKSDTKVNVELKLTNGKVYNKTIEIKKSSN